MSRWKKLLETLLPSGSDDAARAALRAEPEKYQEYLNALDQEYGPKAERAKQMGFDPEQTWYHGSFSEIDAFNPPEKNPKNSFLGRSNYLTSSPVDASNNYAQKDGPDIEVKANDLINELNREGLDYSTAAEKADRLLFKGKDSGAVYPVHLKAENPVDLGAEFSKNGSGWVNLFDTANELRQQAGKNRLPYNNRSPGEAVRQELVDKGHDVAFIRPSEQWPQFPDVEPDDVHAMVQKPENIRSKFAAFDPRFAKSKDILAGTAGAAVLGATAMGGSEAEAAPLDKARILANEYAKLKGLAPVSHAAPDAKVNVDRARKIAEAFEAMKHDPGNPEVKKAYDALVKETADQFELLKDSGLNLSKIKPGMNNPYKDSKAMISDIAENNHLYYFPTEQGFGSGDAFADHPLLKEISVGNEKMPANDAFRVIHDYFGHAKEGSGFGPKGEENAWREHMKMFSPEAQKALTTETRGQNSWVNYGPKGEANRANPAATTFADQKAGLLPDFAYDKTAIAGAALGAGVASGYTPPSAADVHPFNAKVVGDTVQSGLEALEDYDKHVIQPTAAPIKQKVESAIDWLASPSETSGPKEDARIIDRLEPYVNAIKNTADFAVDVGADPTTYLGALPAKLGTKLAPKGGPALAEAAARKVFPEFSQHVAQMVRNPKAPVTFDGPVPAKFQRLRDFLGHTGPIIMKGGQ